MKKVRNLARALVRGLGLGLLAAATFGAAAATIRVGSVAGARFGSSWTLDGSNMTVTRTKLLAAANFGPGGVVTDAVTITDTANAVGSVDATLLANFDVFFIGYLDDGNPNAFTAAELAAFQHWVYNGGTMIVTCDDDQYDAVCAHFGHPARADAPSQNPIVPTSLAQTHPMFNGPFGAVPSLLMWGTQGAFAAVTGATVLAVESGASLPAVLVRQFGAGRIVFLGDVDLISNNTLSAGVTLTNPNDRFLGNLFAFITSIAPQAGLWWNPAEDGSGYNIDVKHNVVVVTTFSYKPNGDSEWYISSGPLSGNVFTGTLLKARNGQCISCAYTGTPVSGGSDGTITLRFSSPTSATAFLPGGRTVPIQPQAF